MNYLTARYAAWLCCGLITALLSVMATTGGRVVSATSMRSPATVIPVPTLTPMQRTAEQASRVFFAAYNRRDTAAILGLLTNQFRYVDCNFAHHQMVLLDSRPALRRWLRARFREHDRFGPLGPLFADPGPGKAGVTGPATRYSDSLDPLLVQGLVPRQDVGGKLVVRPNGRIELVALEGDPLCLAGTRPPGAKPKRERALAQAFLSAYDRHDPVAVLKTLTDDISYTDCSNTPSGSTTLYSKAAVAEWLRARFADGDRIEHARVLTDSFLSEPPNNTRTVVVKGARKSRELAANGAVMHPVSVTILPNFQVTRVRLLEVAGGCPAVAALLSMLRSMMPVGQPEEVHMAFIIRALITICIISLPSIVSASRVPGPAKITTRAWLYGWPMAGHDPERTNRSPGIGPTHPHLLWKRRGTTADAVDQNGSIYATMGTRTIRLDGTGRQRTAYVPALGPVGLSPNGVLFTAGLNVPKGHKGPAVSEESAVAAFSPSGKLLWKIQPTGLLKGAEPLVTESGNLYAPFEGPGDVLAGLDLISPGGKARYIQRGPAFFTAALAPSGTIYALTYSHVSDTSYVEALDPTGTILWQHPLDVSVEEFPGPRLLVGNDGTLYATDGGDLLAYDPAGHFLWRFRKPDKALALAERADGVLLIAGQRVLDAVSPQGTRLWHRKIGTGKSLFSSLIVDAAGKAYVGTGGGRLSVFSADGGLLSRVTVGPSSPISSPVSLLGPDGTLIVNGTDGRMRVYSPGEGRNVGHTRGLVAEARAQGT